MSRTARTVQSQEAMRCPTRRREQLFSILLLRDVPVRLEIKDLRSQFMTSKKVFVDHWQMMEKKLTDIHLMNFCNGRSLNFYVFCILYFYFCESIAQILLVARANKK